MRIFALSDLHADFRANRERLARIPAGPYRRDALIVAGDVADRADVIRDTLGGLRDRFAELFFVPGNHELWVRDGAGDSLEKFHAVLELCGSLGVRTRPGRAGGVWIVPLFSWYTPDFDVRGEGVEAELEGWADFHFCRWPEGMGPPDEHFLSLNEPHLRDYPGPVVSFSHFVPRPDLLPPVRWLSFKGLPRVAGTPALDAQVRRLGAAVHVFGHTHITEDRTVDGVRYVQNWLRPDGSGAGPDAPLKRVWSSDALPSENLAPLFC